MTDLTERLRASVTYEYMPMKVRKMLSEAATTLETLTQENARLKAVSDDHFHNAQRLAKEVAKRDVENARLREAMLQALDAPMIDHNDSSRSVYGILRKALGGGDE